MTADLIDDGPPPPDAYDQGVMEADFGLLDDAEQEASDSGGEPSESDVPARAIPPGMTVDRVTGELRAKIKPGRPAKRQAQAESEPPPVPPPAAEQLAAMPPPEPPPPDRPPALPARGRRPQGGTAEPAADVPMPKGGVIAAGVNKLYRRAGRFIKVMDLDVGLAVIECTKPDPDDDEWLTVGQAWEELAKTHPEIRRWLVKLIAGGAWGDLIMAHAPIGIALAMKPAVMRLIPLHRLMQAFSDDDDEEDGEGGGPLAGLSKESIDAMARQAGLDASQVAAMAARMGGRLTPPYAQHDLSPDEGDGNRHQRRATQAQARRQPAKQSRAQRAKAGSAT